MYLAVGGALLAPLQLDDLAFEVGLEAHDPLFDLRDLDATVLNLALDLGAEPDRLLAHLDLGLAPAGLDLPFDVGEQLLPRLLGRPYPRRAHRPQPRGRDAPSGHEPCEHRHEREHQILPSNRGID